jgi:hypothetical protein
MANYLFAYRGGGMADTDEAREAVMAAWGAWFSQLGDAVVDMGNPFAGSASVGAGGATGEASSGLTGYSLLKADSLADASKLAEGCPVLPSGSVDVYEALAVM